MPPITLPSTTPNTRVFTAPNIEITDPKWDNWEFTRPTLFDLAWQLNSGVGPFDIVITKPDGTNTSFPGETGRSKSIYVQDWPVGNYIASVIDRSTRAVASRPFSFKVGTPNVAYYPSISLGTNANASLELRLSDPTSTPRRPDQLAYTTKLQTASPGTAPTYNTITLNYRTTAWQGEIYIEVLKGNPPGGELMVNPHTVPADSRRNFRDWTEGTYTFQLSSRFTTGTHYTVRASISYRVGGVPTTGIAVIGFYVTS